MLPKRINELLNNEEFRDFCKVRKNSSVLIFRQDSINISEIKDKYRYFISFFSKQMQNTDNILYVVSKLLRDNGELFLIDKMSKTEQRSRIEGAITIENIRPLMNKAGYGIRCKNFNDSVWCLKISQKKKYKTSEIKDYDLVKYPFSNMDRFYIKYLFDSIRSGLELKNETSLVYDGKSIGDIRTLDFYGVPEYQGKDMIIAPYLVNSCDHRGYLKKLIRIWNKKNDLYIPLIKKNIFQNRSDFQCMVKREDSLIIMNAVKKENVYLYITKRDTKSVSETISITYHKESDISEHLIRTDIRIPYFNVFLLKYQDSSLESLNEK